MTTSILKQNRKPASAKAGKTPKYANAAVFQKYLRPKGQKTDAFEWPTKRAPVPAKAAKTPAPVKAAKAPTKAAKAPTKAAKAAPLRDAMLDDLKKSGLTAADAKTLNYQPFADARSLGLSRDGAGYKIPYYNAEDVELETFRFRYFETTGTGFFKGSPPLRKYDQPRDTTPEIYLPRLSNVDWKKIIKDPSQRLFIVEGEKKAACGCKNNLVTVGVGGVFNYGSKKHDKGLRPGLEEFFEKRGRTVYICYDSDAVSNRQVRVAENRLARLLTDRGATVYIVRIPPDGERKVGMDDYIVAHGTTMFEELIAGATRFDPAKNEMPTWPDGRPTVQLPGDNRLISDCASELGEHLGETMFLHNGEAVTCDEGSIEPVSAQSFRTLVERTLVCIKRKRGQRGELWETGVTMTESDARGILASNQFKHKLLPLKRTNTCRLPVIRDHGGRVELLPEGYDDESQIYTRCEIDYREDLPIADALTTLNDLFGEFRFADGGRSKAAAVATLIGLYASQLLAEGELRPFILITKNAEGAGATTLAACAIIPVLGHLPTGTMPDDDGEMRKRISASVREAQPVLMLDNVKGRVGFPSLESFLSTAVWTDRLLGSTETMTGPNLATVFMTANGATISPDMRRRTLFVELHLEVERAEDKVFKRPLSVPVLKALRPSILAACWSLVRNWDCKGRPAPSRPHSAFPEWAHIIGGIVECAGFACPLETANASADADEDGADMRTLVAAMAESKGKWFRAEELIALCRRHAAFVGLVGQVGSVDMTRPQNSAFGYMLKRYDHRTVGKHKFIIEGKGHKRRFRVDGSEHGDMVEHGISPRASKIVEKPLREKDHVIPCHHVTSATPRKLLKFTREGAQKKEREHFYSKIILKE